MPQDSHAASAQGLTLNVGIGTRMQIQLGRKGHELKITGLTVGMIPQEFLIIRIPAIPGILSRLDDDALIVARYVYHGNVYGFSSTILNYIHKPALLVFLSYPDDVEIVNLRKTQRIESRLPVVLHGNPDDCKAVIVDISLGGCRVCVDSYAAVSSSFDIDQTVPLSFHLTGITEEQVISGTVKNIKKDGQLSEMGIQFDQENEPVLNNLRLYIDSLTTWAIGDKPNID